MERPFDTPRGTYEIRTAASCAAKVRHCIAHIRENNLTGERLETYRHFIRAWRDQQRYYRKMEKRA